MPWNILTSADVSAEILPDEIATLSAVQGNTSILDTILATVLAELQAQILVGGNQIGPAGTIPDQIRGDAIAIVRWRLFCSLPKTELQSDFRKAQYESAQKHLDRIREGKEKVEIPASAQNTTGPSNRVQVIRHGVGARPETFRSLGET